MKKNTTKRQRNNRRVTTNTTNKNTMSFFKRMKSAWSKGWNHVSDHTEEVVVDTVAEYKYYVECKLDSNVVVRHAYAVCMTVWYVMQLMWIAVAMHVCVLYKRIRKNK